MKRIDRVVIGSGLLLASMASHAALTVAFTDALTDIGTTAAAIVGVLIAIKAATFVFGLLKRA